MQQNFDKPSYLRTPKLFLLYLGLAGLIYGNGLGSDFVFDDQFYVVENHLIKSLSFHALWEMFSSFYIWDYLPLTIFSLSLDYWLYGLNPFGFHLTNLILHCCNCLLLYHLILRIAGREKQALLVSLIFLVHPIQVESVEWIFERKNLLSFLFFGFSFLTYLKRGASAVSLLLFLLACLSKTSVVVLPLLLILYDISFTGKPTKEILFQKIPYFLIALGIVALALLSHSQGGTLREHPEGNPFFTFLSMLAVFKEYLIKIFFPFNLNVWYPDQIYRSFLSPQVLLSVCVIAAYAFSIRWAYLKNRTAFFGLVWFPVSLLPVSHIVPFPQMMADRFLYIPAVGIILAASTLISKYPLKIFVYLFIFLCSILSMDRVQIYKDEFHLWQDSVNRNPNNTRSVMFLGLTYWKQGDSEQALKYLNQARVIEPKNNKALLYSAHIYTGLKQWEKAESGYRQLVAKNPDRPEYYNHLAVFLGKAGKVKEAFSYIKQALEKNPDFALAYYNRATFLIQAGDLEGALHEYQTAVNLKPNSASFQYTLGMFYRDRTNRNDLANHHLQQSLRLNPDQKNAGQIRKIITSSTHIIQNK